MVRRPRTLVATTEPPRTRMTMGASAAGSAWATLPPNVPRVRMASWPT